MRAPADIPGSTIQCYSQRLLNPFRGVVNIIRYKSAEAVTSDGVRWDIYVSNDSLLDGLDRKKSVQISDIRYGKWSRREGLKRGAIYPSDEFYRLEEMGAVVYEHLLKVHDQLPFTFNDSIELWLLDKSNRPLALLNAVAAGKDIEDYQLLDWRAGRLCRETFSSSVVVTSSKCEDECAADILIRCVNSRTDRPPSAQWFETKQDGSATGLSGHNLDNALTGRVLDSDDFPEFFIATGCGDDDYARLARDFLEWQAPWLLLLNKLSPEQRRHFEQCARRQATIVDQQYLLYPEIIDESFIRAARVEARLRRAQMQDVDQDEVMSTFYIELNPSPTE